MSDHQPDLGRLVPSLVDMPRFQMPVIKSPPEYAFESLRSALQSFQRGLDADTEIGIIASGAATVIHIESLSFNGQMFTFDGVDSEGRRSRVIQHFTQTNIQLIAVPKTLEQPRRIGF
jgi:hypothetical protein